VNPTFQTPHNAIFFHAVLTVIYLMSGTFDALLIILTNVVRLFFSIIGTGMMLLRLKESRNPTARKLYHALYRLESEVDEKTVADASHIYHTPFWMLFLFTVLSWFLTFLPLKSAPVETLLSFAFVISGIPVHYGYLYWQRRGNDCMCC
jgi:amino acid transporter